MLIYSPSSSLTFTVSLSLTQSSRLLPLHLLTLICRNIVGIVDNLGQVVFKTLSDEFVVRDAIKAYLVSLVFYCSFHITPFSSPSSFFFLTLFCFLLFRCLFDIIQIATINAKRLAVGDKPKVQKKENEEKQEKGTLERMATGLLKHAGRHLLIYLPLPSLLSFSITLARFTFLCLWYTNYITGIFLELAKQLGVEFPKEHEGEIKPTEIGLLPLPLLIPIFVIFCINYVTVRAQDAGAIATSLAQIEAHVRHVNQAARSPEKIDALVVDELVRVVDEISAAMKRVEDVVCEEGRGGGGEEKGEGRGSNIIIE